MKKVLALVLAVMMLGTVAFAADIIPGSKWSVPGTTAAWYDGAGNVSALPKDLTSKNFTVKKANWTEGKDLVQSVKIDDDDMAVVVTLKQDYNMTKAKNLKGTIEVKMKAKPYTVYTLYVTNGVNAITVGYTPADLTIDANGDIPLLNPDDQTVYTVKASTDNQPYGTLTFNASPDVDVTVRVYEKEKYYLAADVSPDKKILIANADSDATINFIKFPAKPTFNANATVNFYGLEEDDFVYENKDGKLVKSGAKWDDDTGTWVLKTRTLGAYVTSDKALVASSAAETPDNPDTGANDVVGIATALAAVALVSAAAVSLKK